MKGANKDAKIYVGRSTTLHYLLFVSPSYTMHELRNLLVSTSVLSKQLLRFMLGQCQQREQKPRYSDNSEGIGYKQEP